MMMFFIWFEIESDCSIHRCIDAARVELIKIALSQLFIANFDQNTKAIHTCCYCGYQSSTDTLADTHIREVS